MIGSGKKEGWPECFQDLGSWCPLPQDELHTPKVNLQDEFNFSNDDGHANEWDLLSSPVDLQSDPWVNETQFGILPCQQGIGEINNTLVQELIPLGVISNKTSNILGSGGKLLYTLTTDGSRSPLKPKGNVLLSQGIVKSVSEDSTFLSMAATVQHKTNNPVIISNDCYVLPIAMPEIDSAKLNSSSLSTSFITSPPVQTPTPTPPSTTTKKVSIIREDTACGALSQHSNLESILVKEEHQGLDSSFKVPPVCTQGGSNVLQPLPIFQRERPQLKLNIAAATKTSKITSTLNTPEVLKSLEEDSKFNLLQYVCNDDDFSGLSQDVDEEGDRNVGEQAIRDHDYIDPWQAAELKSDFIIKSEPGSPVSTSCSVSNSSTNKNRIKRKRQRDDSSDYIASESDESESEEDSQQEWSPSPAKKRAKRKSSINSTKGGSKIGNGGKKPGGRRNSSNESSKVNVGQDKYRALRERNNEASRRSRMNRKQRDVEMLQVADELQKKNIYLTARAEKMESLVKYMRAEIMKAFTKPK